MRLRIRSVISVAFLLVLFIVLAYQAQNLNDESKLRLKRSHQKELRDRFKQKSDKMFVDAMSAQKPRVKQQPTPNSAFQQKANPLHDKDHLDEDNSKQKVKHLQDTDHFQDASSKQGTKLQRDFKHHKNINSKLENNRQDHHNEILKDKLEDMAKPNDEFTTKTWTELFHKFEAFQSTDEIEFPTKDGVAPRIPHIIHQILPDVYVIKNYTRYIRSFVENNPKWEYRFWSYDSGRRLIAEKHPYLLSTFDNFATYDIKKVDLIKYTVMYEFGGLYSDIDVKNLRPLATATMKYACIIPTEPFEHAAFLFEVPVIVNVGIFMCRPKHPFFKLVLRELHAQRIKYNAHPLKTTGALYLTRVYMLYNNISFNDMKKPKIDNDTNTPYFYKGTIPEDDDNAIYIPNSQYFMDKVDPIIVKDNIPVYCRRFRYIQEFENLLLMPRIAMRGCAEYERRKIVRRNKKYTFTEHYWHHIWTMEKNWLGSLDRLHIRDIVPHYKFY